MSRPDPTARTKPDPVAIATQGRVTSHIQNQESGDKPVIISCETGESPTIIGTEGE